MYDSDQPEAVTVELSRGESERLAALRRYFESVNPELGKPPAAEVLRMGIEALYKSRIESSAAAFAQAFRDSAAVRFVGE